MRAQDILRMAVISGHFVWLEFILRSVIIVWDACDGWPCINFMPQEWGHNHSSQLIRDIHTFEISTWSCSYWNSVAGTFLVVFPHILIYCTYLTIIVAKVKTIPNRILKAFFTCLIRIGPHFWGRQDNLQIFSFLRKGMERKNAKALLISYRLINIAHQVSVSIFVHLQK